MIFKLIPRRSVANRRQGLARIRNLVNYIGNPETEDGKEKCHHLQFLNLISENKNLALMEFLSAGQSPDCKADARGHPRQTSALIEHCVLSWQESETPSVRDIDVATRLFLRTFNPNALCMTGVHVNTENLHMHLAVQKYDPFGKLLVGSENPLPHWHAALAVLEKARGFLSEPNALFQARPMPDGNYLVQRRTGGGSRRWLEPVERDLLPIISFKGPEPFFPDFVRRNRHYYDRRNPAGAPVMYIPAPGFLAVPGWRHPALPLNLERSTNPTIVIHNVQEKEKIAHLHLSPAIIPPSQLMPAPRKPPAKKPDDIFIACVDRMAPSLHISSRESYAAMHILDLGFDRDSLGECLEKHSRTDNDSLRPLHVRRALAFAERPVNRLRKPDFAEPRRKKWQARRYLEETSNALVMARRKSMGKKIGQEYTPPVIRKEEPESLTLRLTFLRDNVISQT